MNIETHLMELEGFLKAQYQYVNRICYEPPVDNTNNVDFESIGLQPDGKGGYDELFNCMKDDCTYGCEHTTLYSHHLEDHYNKYHKGMKE